MYLLVKLTYKYFKKAVDKYLKFKIHGNFQAYIQAGSKSFGSII